MRAWTELFSMIFFFSTQAILALATFYYHVAALEKFTIMALSSTTIKDIEGNSYIIIAQTT